MRWVPLTCAHGDGKKDRRFGQAVHGHLQQASKVRQRPAMPKAKTMIAHMFDGGISEKSLYVRRL